MIIMLILLSIVASFFLMGWGLSTPPYHGPKSDHFNGKRFLNRNGAQANGFSKLFKWFRQREPGPWQWKENNLPNIPESSSNPRPRIYYINHSSFLIQIDGFNILTDPVFSKRVSPFSFAGPRRMRPPGVAFEDLPPIDMVLLSHNHYDHLDIKYVKRIAKTWDPVFLVPLGIQTFLKKHQISRVTELDWWDQFQFKNLQIIATEAQHFSGRGMFDRDRSLWCGFSIKSDQHHIVYVGDTGFGNFFRNFPEKIGIPDLAFIPIGAFKPTWFMRPIHCTPEEAIRIHQMVGAKKSIACHHGTFPLGDDGMDEPVKELNKAMAKAEIPKDTFIVLENGDMMEV